MKSVADCTLIGISDMIESDIADTLDRVWDMIKEQLEIQFPDSTPEELDKLVMDDVVRRFKSEYVDIVKLKHVMKERGIVPKRWHLPESVP